VTVPAFPDHSFEARVTLVGPLIDPVKRTAKVCISISNDGQLRPGMYADVSVEIDLGEGIGVPFDSVLPTGSKMLVFVDRGFGKLEPRAIQVGCQFLGPSGLRYYQVTDGLWEGIVSSANFLVDAEAQIQGAVRNWHESAESSMAASDKRGVLSGSDSKRSPPPAR
jgi:membrane fusion protein, copper/silver efflux system